MADQVNNTQSQERELTRVELAKKELAEAKKEAKEAKKAEKKAKREAFKEKYLTKQNLAIGGGVLATTALGVAGAFLLGKNKQDNVSNDAIDVEYTTVSETVDTPTQE